MARRRIAFVTGTRAEFGLLHTALEAARRDRRLTPQLIVTGMHLLKGFGQTIKDIRRAGTTIDARVPMYAERENPLADARALAKGVEGIATQLQRLDSDIVVVLGDRLEALAGALAGCTTRRFVAHIHGGDVAPGFLDDAFRHSITKLSHIHLAATQDAAARITRLGEQDNTIHVVGAPGLDHLIGARAPKPGWLQGEFGWPAEQDVALIIQHPIGRTDAVEGKVMRSLLQTVRQEGLAGLIVYPNRDPGHGGIIEAIRLVTNARQADNWAVAQSLPRHTFIKCLQSACVLVGNSSCGIIEAYTARTPTVNIGARQDGRVRNRSGTIDCAESQSAMTARCHPPRSANPL